MGGYALYSFNPSTGEVKGIVNDYLNNKNISGLEAGIYGDKNEMLWVCNATVTEAEVVIINSDDHSIDEKISTNLLPQKVVFITQDDNFFITNQNDNDDDQANEQANDSNAPSSFSSPQKNEGYCFIGVAYNF